MANKGLDSVQVIRYDPTDAAKILINSPKWRFWNFYPKKTWTIDPKIYPIPLTVKIKKNSVYDSPDYSAR